MSFNEASSGTVELNNQALSLTTLKLTGFNLSSFTTVGIGITALGTNAPSGLLSLGVGSWARVTLSNGSTGYIPVWV